MGFRCHPSDFIPTNLPNGLAFPHLSQVRTDEPESETSPARDWLLFLAYELMPEQVWGSERRLVGVCQDCHLLWHLYRLRSRDLDAVICPPQWEPAFRLAGNAHVVPACLTGPTEPLTRVPPETPRPIDLLVVGNLNPAIHPERTQSLTALARLYPAWSVRVVVSLAFQEYRPLLEQSRFVLRIADENAADGLLFEATTAGAAVLQNVQGMLLPPDVLARAAVLPFAGEIKREEFEAILSDEEGRRALVARAQFQTPWTYWEGLERALADLEKVLPRVRPRRDLPSFSSGRDRLIARVWQAMSSRVRDPHLVRDLEEALRGGASAVWHNALGVALSRPERDAVAGQVAAGVAAAHFRRAVELDPRHPLAALNLVHALQACGDHDAARREAERALSLLDLDGPADESWLDEPHAHYDFGSFRVEWEKAAWANAGSPETEGRAKRNLLCREFHTVLAGITESVAHHYEAFLARPDLIPTVAALGRRLAQSENPLLALSYLTRAVHANPLDSATAAALFQVLGRVGERQAQALFARDRLRLHWVAPGLLPAEPWAHLPPPADDERVSIVILCRNLAEVTRVCLDSLLRTTDVPYELIVVDNGSDDQTPELLREYQRRAGPTRFVVVRNESNLGFARGCNQGMAQARGRYLLLLNNDVILTPGWLRGLLRAMVAGWPTVAAVGPMTNYAPPPQRVAADYDLPDGLDAFARKFREANAGRVLDVQRLTGFCLLIRREVLDRVGGLDDRFRTGFFEDDDLCVRIRESGWKLRVAQDVFIHHFGSKTFQDLRIDTRELLQENFKRFRNKWGEEHTRGYRLVNLDKGSEDLPGVPVEAVEGFLVSPPAAALRPRITLSMIVKNEEKNLPDCLRTAADLFDEVVIADTGSTDRTREIAASFGARIVEFLWVDSFGAARNASLREVRTPWVMWLDADDRFDEDNRRKLKEVIASLDERPDPRAIKVRSFMDPQRTLARLLDQVRIFPNLPGVEWEYRIHEQILPSVRKHGGNVIWTDVIVDHVGYQFPEARRGKLDRNLRLLELDYQEHRDDPFTLFNLGWTKLDLGRAEEAYQHLKESLERTDAGSSIRRKLFDLLAHAAEALGKLDEAPEWLEKGLKLYPDDCELLLHRAELYRRADDPDGAARCLEQVLAGPPSRYFASLDDGARGYRTRHRLAELYLARGRGTEAEIQWRVALEERPQFVPATLGLGELLLSRGRWAEVDEVAGRLEQVPNEAVNAEVMRCRARMARGEYAEARARLEELITAHPKLVGPRVLLTHVLLRQGEDWPAAEAHLLGVLALAPDHREARHNLGLLRQNHPQLRPVAAPPAFEVLTVCHGARDPLLPAYVKYYLQANAAAVHLVLVGDDWDLVQLAGREGVHLHDLSRTLPEEMPVAIRELRDRLIPRADFLLVSETDEWLLPRHGTSLAEVLSAYRGEPVLGAVTYEVLPGADDRPLDLGESLPKQRSRGIRQDRDTRPAAFGSKPAPRWRHQERLAPFLRLRFGRADSHVYRERRASVPLLPPEEQPWESWLTTPGAVCIPDPSVWPTQTPADPFLELKGSAN